MSNKIKNVVVTGATGFIGSSFIKVLLEQSYNVTAVIRNSEKKSNLPKGCIPSLCDVLDYEPIAETISRSDIVFHLAGLVGVKAANKDPYKAIDVNVLGTINVLDAARYFNKPVVFGGVANFNDLSIYSITKATSERFLMMYNKEHNCNFLPLRIFNVFGPGQNINSGKLIINAIKKGILGEPITVFGKGDQVMDFIYIDDVIKHLEYCLLNSGKFANRPFDVGSGIGVSVLDAVKLIVKMTGNKSEILFEPKRSGDEMKKIIADKNNFFYKTTNPIKLEEGIEETIRIIKKSI